MEKFKKWFGRTSDTNLLLTITIVVFFAMYIGAIVFQGKGFLKPQTFFNILNTNAALIITACGMSIVMICGGIDISVGGVVALVSMSCAVYLDRDVLNPEKYADNPGKIFVALLIALGIGLTFGLVQGFLVAYLDIQPFIVSLAGMFFARGMTTIVHTAPFNVENKAFVALIRFGQQARKLRRCLCRDRCNSCDSYSYLTFHSTQMDKARTQLLCSRWKCTECFDARNKRKENKVPFTPYLRTSRRCCRFRIFHACRIGICFTCKWYGNECNRIIHHRWNNAYRWCRKYRRYILRCSVTFNNSEYRCFGRTWSGLVDRYHNSCNALYLPCNTECYYG